MLDNTLLVVIDESTFGAINILLHKNVSFTIAMVH